MKPALAMAQRLENGPSMLGAMGNTDPGQVRLGGGPARQGTSDLENTETEPPGSSQCRKDTPSVRDPGAAVRIFTGISIAPICQEEGLLPVCHQSGRREQMRSALSMCSLIRPCTQSLGPWCWPCCDQQCKLMQLRRLQCTIVIQCRILGR